MRICVKNYSTERVTSISYFHSLGSIFFLPKNIFDIEKFSTTVTCTSVKSVSVVCICTSKYSLGEENELRFAPTATIFPTTSKAKLEKHVHICHKD